MIPQAMVEHCAEAYKRIAEQAAVGVGAGDFLCMMAHVHEIMQSEKDEADAGRQPIVPKFVIGQADGPQAAT